MDVQKVKEKFQEKLIESALNPLAPLGSAVLTFLIGLTWFQKLSAVNAKYLAATLLGLALISLSECAYILVLRRRIRRLLEPRDIRGSFEYFTDKTVKCLLCGKPAVMVQISFDPEPHPWCKCQGAPYPGT